MNFIRNLLRGNINRWTWYIATIGGSALPIIVRFITCLDSPGVKWFDIKDLLFMGLAINLSNFILVGIPEYKDRANLAIISGFLLIPLSFALGRVMIDETSNQPNTFLWLKLVSTIFVIFSIGLSYEANRFNFESVNA